MSTLAPDDVALPPFPDVAAAVLRQAQDPEAGIDKVATLVQRDPALAAEVLRVANTAALGGRIPAVTLIHAIGRMGTAALADLTVAVCLRPQPTDPSLRRHLKPVWSHAVATAGFARRISAMRRRQVESAFLCGLLHSIGAIALLNEGITDRDVIADRYVGFGTKIAMSWLMPASVVAAVGLHRDWQTAHSYLEEASTTWLACQLASELLDQPVAGGDLDLDPVIDHLDIYPDDLQDLRDHGQDVRSLVTMLG